ncbi:cysteine desulfurase-like protein, partial [filamentous cyanobacterium CCP5]
MTVASTSQAFPIAFVRQQFPSLNSPWIFMDNAGGSQILQPVIDRISEYLLTSNVQLGASYRVSELATARLAMANQQAATLVNAADASEVVMGPSTSMLLRILAHCYGQTLKPGDEVIVTNCDHEANITPWKALTRQGIRVKVWPINPDTLTLELADLEPLMGDRTRLVSLVHASNVLGTIHPVRAIADFVHQRGAHLCVDGVGYAPHRLIDVEAMDVDFYVFSFYKVYGPHHAMLYG